MGSEPTTSTGVQVTKSVPFARESIDRIRALAPFRTQAVPGDRAIPLRRIQRRSGTTGGAGLPSAGISLAAPFLASSPALSAPALASSFAGLGNPPHSEGDVIPPDTMGAAGPNHLVSLLNSDFGVFDKSGALLQKVSLETFWASLGTAAGEPANFPFDTKILYDQHSGSFIAVTLGGTSSPNSWVMIGVSSTSNPLDNWVKWAIDADMNNNVQTGNSADFPGLGVDAFNVYVTANMFNGNSSQYSKVWVIPKAQLLAGSNPITWFEFFPPNTPGWDFTMQPAHTFGTAAAEYFLYEGSTNQLDVAWMDNTSGTPVWHSPLHVPVAPYTSGRFPAGRPPEGQRQHDRHVGYAPSEHRVPERLRLDHPPSRRERKGGGRLVQNQPWNRHGCIAGTDQRPESLVLLPLHRGQPGQRRGGRVQRLIDHRICRGILHHRPAVYRDRGAGGGAEGRRCPLLENIGRDRESMGRLQRDHGRSDRQCHVLDRSGVRADPRSDDGILPMGNLVGKIHPGHGSPSPAFGRRRWRRRGGLSGHSPARDGAAVCVIADLRRYPAVPRVCPRIAAYFPPTGAKSVVPAPPLLSMEETRWRGR